ncbi:two component transcriptional regulator, LytTR family [Hymenobacter daecheongensis DSM 21074]|uniref:Two component transcriptional regulator, LytTR family n=1 Tax=Hymenobacter daecheongensis DSM 21074 TaxID=1121955 RepID=A0A1M6IXU7_9BACT|nr:response regulator [Hymenobacter daecheongensis]SHJ39251.1 two component transcriptional regulator, LytTR family [Hymenobacter daecheongensis DSM 21074]
MSQPLRCYVIDDEPAARELITKYIGRIPYLELIGQATNAIDALFALETLQPDVLFLDVEMPEMTGFEFLRVLAAQTPDVRMPAVVMITAYPQYAVQGYEHEVADYLLKPASFERFMRAINRVAPRRLAALAGPPAAAAAVAPPEPVAPVPAPAEALETAEAGPGKAGFFLVKEDKKLIRLVPQEIVFVESLKDYLNIYLTSRTITTHMTMTKLEAMLPADQFMRVNRSYLVRLGAIKEIDGNLITTADGKRVPIGVTYRERVMEAMKQNMM